MGFKNNAAVIGKILALQFVDLTIEALDIGSSIAKPDTVLQLMSKAVPRMKPEKYQVKIKMMQVKRQFLPRYRP